MSKCFALVNWSLTSLFSTNMAISETKVFRVFALLLHRRCSTEVNKTLQDVRPSPGVVHYMHICFSGALAPKGILQGAKFTLRPSLAFSYIGSVTAPYSSSGR